MQASLQTTADEWAASRFWTHMEGRHAQGPDTTSLYPANIGHGEVGSQRFRRHGLVVGRGENLFLRFRLRFFRGSVLLG